MDIQNTPANGGQILTDERIECIFHALDGKALIVGENQLNWNKVVRLAFGRAIEADLLASLAAPATENAPNVIAATMRHDAGAYARCSYCHRYSIDPATLSDRQPVCECGKQHGWCGSFVRPDANSTWSGKSPAAPAIPLLARIRDAISTDRCDGSSSYAHGVNAAVAKHTLMIDSICAEVGVAPAVTTVDRNARLPDNHPGRAEFKAGALARGYSDFSRMQSGCYKDDDLQNEWRLVLAAQSSAAPASVPQPDTPQGPAMALAICNEILPALGQPTPRVTSYSGRVQVVEAALHRIRSILSAPVAQPAAQSDEPTDREALIASLEDDAAKLADANPDDEMAQTMREAAAMLESDAAQPAAQVALTEDEQLALMVKVEDYMQAVDWAGTQTHAKCDAAEAAIFAKVNEFISCRATPATVKTAEGE